MRASGPSGLRVMQELTKKRLALFMGVTPLLVLFSGAVTYGYQWVTPLHWMMPTLGPGYIMVKANSMRMEPIL